MTCACCGHDRTAHPLRTCREAGCPCMRFVEDTGADLPLSSIGWQGMAMTGVLDLIATKSEGVVHVATADGNECVVKVTFRPLAPFTCSPGGKA